MLSPGSITNSVPDPDKFIRDRRDIQRNAQELASARSLAQSQIGNGGTLTVDGSLRVNGSISLPGTLSSSGAFVAGTSVTAGTSLNGASLAVTGAGTFGTVSTTGDTSAAGTLIGTAGVRSPGARANVLSTWIAAQLDPSGNLGIVSSSVDVKQDFRPVDMSGEVAALLQATMLEFRYIEHVKEYGDDAPVMLGSIAQYLEAIGLGRYVTRNLDGEIDGIQYDQLTKPLIATVQFLDARLRSVEDRLTAAGL